MKKLSVKTILLCLFLFLTESVFAEINVLSPVEGNWSNKQMLIIDTSKGGEFFFSVDGSDPQTVGFAYDEPILLDVSGNVSLRIFRLLSDGTSETKEVRYSVKQNPGDQKYSDFISSFIQTGIYNYSAGTGFEIPSRLQFSLEDSPIFNPGQTLYLNPDCILSRFIPCVIFDSEKNLKWRFYIHTFPQNAGVYSRVDVPFYVTDWEKITFTDDNLLYKIDDSYWALIKEPVILDRSVPHTIYWQSLNYEAGNPIQSFTLPEKPVLKEDVSEDGSVIFSVENPDYMLSLITNDVDSQELFERIGVDTFYGDEVQGTLKLGFYASSVYQGEIEKYYSVNKLPPVNPEILSTAEDFYTRNNVRVSFNWNKDSELYVSVSEPYVISDFSKIYKEDDSVFSNISVSPFKKIEENEYTIDFSSDNYGATYYKVYAYTKNKIAQSEIVEYSFIIDQFNYYFDSENASEIQIGTVNYPFSDFSKCLSLMNESRAVCLHVNGVLTIPSGKNILTTNCQVIMDDSSEICFESGATLIVKNSSLEIANTRIKNGSSQKFKSIVPMVRLENSVLTVENCQISAQFSKNGNVIDSNKSVVNISDCVGVVNAASYSSFISAVNSKINIKESVLNSNADTCVVISATDCESNIQKNSMQVTGKNGRIAEFFGGKASLVNNMFKSNLSNKENSNTPVYRNNKTSIYQENNDSYGF